MTVRLTTGASVTLMKRVVSLHYTLEGKEYDDDFIVLDLDDKFDVILGLPWLRLHDPLISWGHRSVKMSAAHSSGGHLMSVSGRPHAQGCVEAPLQFEDPASIRPQEVTETLNVSVNDGKRVGASTLTLVAPPKTLSEITTLPTLEHKWFLRDLRRGKITQICLLVAEDEYVTDIRSAVVFAENERVLSSSSMDDSVLDEKTRIDRFDSQSWESLKTNPLYKDLVDFNDVFPETVPCELPKDKGIRHKIDLKPGSKYCVMKQWPLPREQVEAFDKFFAERLAAGHVREWTSPHSSPTFCVRKATGGWRIVHAFNKLNAATIPAQTPIPRKDVIIDGMAKRTMFSSLDLLGGFYPILMRERDIPYTAVSTPSGMLWEWLVMPQGLSNAPAAFNWCVSHLLRPVRAFAPSYFDDVFVHNRATDGKTDLEVHRLHLREVLTLMRKHKLYANLKKCIFAASEIPVLGCIVGKNGVRPDPEKIRAIKEWPTPVDVKGLQKFLGLAAYLHEYSRNYAEMTVPL
ncbi:hypothetical protein Poli38472_003363 [Pythium oligandrum]|uniref:Reverse transcriptase domain-containing protein n=1 Tax=Pythium oligandrum TaxID=41045 RepID=A0A8K1C6Q2_PYTOL|nr:hypothetical protein Poli38472_003363 [Pythium oligandrum]|eukprot:TMW57438.1 hypothetical protein Poli38472_003363 [Pythium oligandrum]